jgi:hypothetical protein
LLALLPMGFEGLSKFSSGLGRILDCFEAVAASSEI